MSDASREAHAGVRPATSRVPLGELVRGARLSGTSAEFEIGPDWLQGRSLFGGVQAVVGLAAMRRVVPDDLPLRTLQVTFVAPVPPGRVRAEARILRVGRSASQAEARLLQGEDSAAVMVGVFGAARTSAVQHLPRRPDVDAHEAVRLPFVEGRTPAFTRHFVAHWLMGGLPYSGHASRHTVVDLTMRDAGRCSEAHLLALADFIPPVALSMLAQPVPGSSVTWMLEFFADAAAQPLDGWRVDSEMVAAQDGYTSQSNRLWTPDGQLAALSRQSMVVFG